MAVVGAGIVGLAATVELLAREPGAEVRCYEAGEPMQARSVGATRIYRTAHGDSRLAGLAHEAEQDWRDWELRFGLPLIDPTGVVVSGGDVDGWSGAMTDAGLAPTVVDDQPAGLPASRVVGPHLLDRRGGVVRVSATGEVLRRAIEQSATGSVRVGDRVREVRPTGSGVRVVAASGDWDADVALVVAGAGTPELAAQVGLEVPTLVRHHHRFTFRLRDRQARPPAWLDRTETWRAGFTSYQHLAAAGDWAVGGSLPDEDTDSSLPEAEAHRRARAAVTAYVADTLDAVVPEVTDVVHCSSMELGDGLFAEAAGRVVVFWGDNLMKFAPSLGGLLAGCARTGGITDELAGLLGHPSRTPPA
jgi:sarcosine oxidase